MFSNFNLGSLDTLDVVGAYAPNCVIECQVRESEARVCFLWDGAGM